MIQLLLAKNKKKKSGYVIIYAVIILGMVVLGISLYFSWLASFSLRSEIQLRKSKQAQYLADTCAEIALQQIWNDVGYGGSGNLSDFGGSCAYQVSNLGGENRRINSTGAVDNITRKAQVLIDQVNSKVNITSWREVADF